MLATKIDTKKMVTSFLFLAGKTKSKTPRIDYSRQQPPHGPFTHTNHSNWTPPSRKKIYTHMIYFPNFIQKLTRFRFLKLLAACNRYNEHTNTIHHQHGSDDLFIRLVLINLIHEKSAFIFASILVRSILQTTRQWNKRTVLGEPHSVS